MDKITLDRKAFKVLSSDTRVSILRLLEKRRMTLSELATKLDMRASSIKEHLTALESAGLIEKRDEGRKWKYYELTTKGKNVISPMEKSVFIVLALSALIIIFSSYNILGGFSAYSAQSLSVGSEKVMGSAESSTTDATQEWVTESPRSVPGVNGLHVVLLIVSVFIFELCLIYLLRKRR